MAGRRMLPDTVTLYNYAGEDQDGRATYAVTLLRNVYCSEQFGTDYDKEGKTSANKAMLYIFDANSVAESADGAPKSYLPYSEWINSDSKESFWTLSDQGDDYFVNGLHNSNRPQDIRNSHKIVSVSRFKAGQRRMWHWTVCDRAVRGR